MSKTAIASPVSRTQLRTTRPRISTLNPHHDRPTIFTGPRPLQPQTVRKNSCQKQHCRPASSTATADRTAKSQTQVILGQRAKQRQAEKEFFTDLLTSAATKRDAKAFLSRLKSPQKLRVAQTQAPENSTQPERYARPEVNIGNLFGRATAVDQSPVFAQDGIAQETKIEELETLHVALVKIRDVQSLTDPVIDGIAQTLSQLAKLSMAPCVVIEGKPNTQPRDTRDALSKQADRLVEALDRHHETGARKVDGVFNLSESASGLKLHPRKLLLRPLQRGQIPVILPTAFSAEHSGNVVLNIEDAVLALTKDFAGLDISRSDEVDSRKLDEKYNASQKLISLDRIILIDSSGATPQVGSPEQSQVFINLEQEYDGLRSGLINSSHASASQHASNLHLVQKMLQLLPAASSALMTTPEGAANMPVSVEVEDKVSMVGTRKQKNALVHNLLTDKPIYSSSLPAGRLSRPGSSAAHPPPPVATLIKRGMPLTILPDPATNPWIPTSHPRLNLTDPTISLPRLVHLIEDSFNRKLDINHYLDRVNDRIAGLIIAGEYEGGALLTWETPPGADPNDPSRLVPYLDKFAVLKRSQGAGGVADILFNAMVHTCFPGGVCWRSRKDNPVNKWYFERSRGTWKLPDMNWTMFWTTEGVFGPAGGSENGVHGGKDLFRDYEAVCRGVVPSWKDMTKAAD